MIGVVPVFVSAGVAVFPAIVAAVLSLISILLRPYELWRRRNARSMLLAAAVATIAAGVIWYSRAATASRISRIHHPGDQPPRDWALVAEQIIAQEKGGRALTRLSGASGKAETNRQESAEMHPSPRGSVASTGIQPQWRFSPEQAMFLAAPLVSGNRVFAAACQAELGGYTGLLTCVAAETGRPIWQVSDIDNEVLRPFFSSPVLSEDGKYLIVGQGLHSDRDCSLLCFDAQTGRLRWRVRTPLHIESSPAVRGDLVVVGVGAIENRAGGPEGESGFALAVRVSDGEVLWRQPLTDPESSPAIDSDGTVYIGSGFNGRAVAALRSETDEQLRQRKQDRIVWHTTVGLPVTGPITLAGEWVIAGAGNGDLVHSDEKAQGLVVALHRSDGRIRWQTAFADGVLGAIAHRDGVLYAPVRTGEVVALRLDDGQVKWRTRISGDAAILGGCIAAGNRVCAVSSDGYFAVLDAGDGGIIEKTYLNDQANPGSGLTASTPRVAGGRVYVGSETGGLQCLAGFSSSE